MKIAVYSAKPHDQCYLDAANVASGHRLHYFESRLGEQSVGMAAGFDAVCVFVNDNPNHEVILELKRLGIKQLLLRCAGHNHVDLKTALSNGICVTHVPEYTPYAVAEHTLALILGLNRHTHQAYLRVRDGNFNIEGLLGFNLHGKTVSLIGAGKIGTATGKILQGFGCTVLANDPLPSEEARKSGFRFVSFHEALSTADIISLHCPLLASNRHLINHLTLSWMKRGTMLINTSRGGLIDTPAILEALETGQLGSVGLDVYENESELFYHDHTGQPWRDLNLHRLTSHPRVLLTGHQGFFTHEAMQDIANSVIEAASSFEEGKKPEHALCFGKSPPSD